MRSIYIKLKNNARSSRYLRAALALPELWFVLTLLLIFWGLRQIAPLEWRGSLGWQVHPYQIFSVLVGLAAFMLPGALLLRLLKIGGSWWVRLPTSMAAAIGVWVIPSMFVASTRRFDVTFLVMAGVVLTTILAAVAYLRLLKSPPSYDNAGDEGRQDPDERVNPLLVGFAILALVIATWISLTGPVALDDNLQVMYVQDNLTLPRINESEPVFGTGIAPQTRTSLTTWLLNLTVITYISDLPPLQAFWLLRTPLTLLNFLAFYVLALRLFGKRNQAIFTVLFYFILTLIYTGEADAIGFSIFSRSAQDKFIARYTLLPVVLALSIAYFRKQDYRFYWLAGIATIGLATTHPVGVILLGIPLAGLGVMHLLNHLGLPDLRGLKRPLDWLAALFKQNWPVIRPFLFLSVFSILGVVVPLLQKASPDAPIVAFSLTDTRDPTLWFRLNLALNYHRLFVADYLGPEAYIVHPRIFLETYLVLPLLGLPFLAVFKRKHLAAQLIVGTFLLNPALLLIPPIVQQIGSSATPWMLYRLAWPIALLGPIAIAWAAWGIYELMRNWLPSRFVLARYVSAVLPALILVLTALALRQEIVQGQVTLAEFRSDTFAARCRTLQPVFSKLPDLVGEGKVILSTPEYNLCIPSSAANAYPVEFGLTTTINRFPESRVPEAIQRLDDVYSFYLVSVVDQTLMELLTRWNVGLVLVRLDHPLEHQLRNLPHFFEIALQEERYVVYRVLPAAGVASNLELPTRERWRVARWQGSDPLVAGNSLWSEGKWEEAIAIFEPLSQETGERGLLGGLGLGRSHLSAGRLDQAIAAFETTTQKFPDSLQAWLFSGNAYWMKGDYESMEYAYRRAVEINDWHPEAVARLGDALRYQGRLDEARGYYEQAASIDITPDTSIYYRELGSMYLSINWTEEAIAILDQSLAIRPSLLGYSLLSRGHQNLGNLEAAAQAAEAARAYDMWSDMPDSLLGQVELKKGNSQAALEYFYRAVELNPISTSISALASTSSVLYGKQAALEDVQSQIGYELGFSEPVFAAARLHFDLGQLEDAISLSQQAWEWKPIDSRAVSLLGNTQLVQGNRQEAAQYFKKSIALNPISPEAYLGMAMVAQLDGDSGTATGWGWSAMSASPHNPIAPVTVANISEVRGDLDEALLLYQNAIQIGPYQSLPFLNLGHFYLEQAQFDLAIGSYQQALEISPNTTSARRGLSSVYQSLGNLPLAFEQVFQAVQAHPAEGVNRILLAEILRQEGNWEAAILQLQLAIEQDPGLQQAYASLADTYLRLDKNDLAEELFLHQMREMPTFPDGYLGIGQLRARLGDEAGAEAAYQQGLSRVSPGISGPLQSALAEIYLKQGREAEAIGASQAAIINQPMFSSSYVALSRYYLSKGDFDSAQAILTHGLNIIPAAPELIIAQGALLVEQGRVEEALTIYQEMLAQNPYSAEISLALANLYITSGQPLLGLAEIERAQRILPGDANLLSQGATLAITVGQPHTAMGMAYQLAALSPGQASAWIKLGEAYSALGQFDWAEAAYLKATQVEPGSYQAWLNLGLYFTARGDIEKSIAAYQQSAEIDHREIAPHLALAEIDRRQGHTVKSLQSYQTIASRDRSQNSALLAAGLVEQQIGRTAEARAYFDQAQIISPLDPRPAQYRADLLRREGNYASAYQELLQAAQRAPGDCRTFINLADHLTITGDLASAEEAYRQTQQLNGCKASGQIGLGNLALLQGKLDQALREFNLAIDSSPGEDWGYILLAHAYNRQGSRVEAFAAYERGLAHVPTSTLIHIAHSRSLISAAQLNEALEAAQASVHLSPWSSAASVALGEAFQALAQYPEAEAVYRQAAELDALGAKPHLKLGHLLNASARFDEAEAAYRHAILVDPTNSKSYTSLANFFVNRDRGVEAVALYELGAEIDRSQVGALLGLAQYYQENGHFPEAEEALFRAFKSAPTYSPEYGYTSQPDIDAEPVASTAQAYLVLGDMRRLQTDWPASEEAYQQAIDAAPGIVRGYVRLGLVYQVQGRASEARQQFELAVQKAPYSAEAHLALGNLLKIQGLWDEAEQSLLAGIDAEPHNIEGYIRLADVYQTRGRLEEAYQQLNQGVQAVPASASGYTALGNLHRSQGDRNASEQAFQAAISLNAADPAGYLGLAEIAQSRCQLYSALKQLTLAVEIAPVSRFSNLALGDWYWQITNRAKAQEYYQKVSAMYPGDFSAHLRLGYLIMESGDLKVARSKFDRALALAPADPAVYIALGDWQRANLDTGFAETQIRSEYQSALDELRKANLNLEEPDEFLEYLLAGVQYQEAGEAVLAYEMFGKAIQANPDSLLPYMAMGQWYRAIPGLSSVEQSYRRAVELAPGSMVGYIHLGRLYYSMNRQSEARVQFEQAVAVAPGLSRSHLALGEWQQERGYYELAEESYRQSILQEPGNVETYLRLGFLYQSQGKANEAQAQFELALKAGLSVEAALCGGSRLPAPGEASASNSRRNTTTSWQCQWDYRLWAGMTDYSETLVSASARRGP